MVDFIFWFFLVLVVVAVMIVVGLMRISKRNRGENDLESQRRTVYSIGDEVPTSRGSRPPAYPDDFVELYFPPSSHQIKDDKDLPSYEEVMRIEAEAAERVAARRQEQGEPTGSTAVVVPIPQLPPTVTPASTATADSRV
ncbi:hypothetical protein ACFFRR_008441 [Megaselia abdita]